MKVKKRLYATVSSEDYCRVLMRLKQHGIRTYVRIHTDFADRIRKHLDVSGQYGLGFRVAPVSGVMPEHDGPEPGCVFIIFVDRRNYKRAKKLIDS